jgi:pilus assembly protein Flp/PilA
MLRLVTKLQTAAANLGSLRRFVPATLRDKKGVTMLEYALIAALIAVAAVTILTTLGGTVSGVFSTINAKMSTA